MGLASLGLEWAVYATYTFKWVTTTVTNSIHSVGFSSLGIKKNSCELKYICDLWTKEKLRSEVSLELENN